MDWWARGIGIAALVIALFGLGWRILEFWATGRANVTVKGSAGVLQQTGAELYLIRSKRVGYSLVVVEVINKGRRAVIINEVGFLLPGSERRTMMGPRDPRTLPKRLEPGDSFTVENSAKSFFENQAEDIDELRPYCRDAEGKTHLGVVDDHFGQLVAAYRANATPQD